jgi:hypothetical protein
MDPKKIAEEIVKDLFNTHELVEEKDEEKDEEEGEEEEAGEEEGEEEAGEEEGEEDEGEEETEDKAPVAKAVGNAMKGSATTSAASSISLKGQLPTAAKSSEVAHDALGGGVKDAHGGGEQMIQPTGGNPGALAASLNMKPSFSSPQMPKMTAEQVDIDIAAIFGSQELTEEFAKNAASIYEAAVTAKVEGITEALVEQFEEKLVEEVEVVKTALVEQLDNYLAYVVQEWAKENKVAIENGLRTEIAEDFIVGLKNLFAESYVEVPEDKVNLFDELSEAVSTLEGRINEEIEKNVELTKEISLLTAQRVFAEETRGLTVLQTEKVKEIAENLEFSGEEDFRNKVQNLVEGVVSTGKKETKPTTKVNEQVTLLENVSNEPSEEEQQQELSPLMELYAKTINRTINS